jgi:hypothetical protein
MSTNETGKRPEKPKSAASITIIDVRRQLKTA